MAETRVKTLQVRIKDRHARKLREMARNVNFVWNYLNDLSHNLIRKRSIFASIYDLQKYTNGCAKELGLHSQTVQQVADEYVTRRKQFKKSKLRWRKSHGKRRSLGWIPLKTGASSWKKGAIYHNRNYFRCWDSWDLSQYKFKSGAFPKTLAGVGTSMLW